MLGQVVVDDKDVFALGHELFSHGAAGVRSYVLNGRGVGCSGGNDDGVFHGPSSVEGTHNLGHLSLFLADGHIDADQVAALLIDDGIQGDGGFAGGTVADDQFPLPAADGNH